MNKLRYTLVSDGSSDIVLLPILTWLLHQEGVSGEILPQWADLRIFKINPPRKLSDKVKRALEYYSCDLLFIHRDAENQDRIQRVCEIYRETNSIPEVAQTPPVCVIPVRMQEAWLLFNEIAIRYASGNRSGKAQLSLPPINKLESLPDPKSKLHECLRKASGLPKRRLKRYNAPEKAHLVSEYIDDFSPLLALPAFKSLRDDLKLIVTLEKWNST